MSRSAGVPSKDPVTSATRSRIEFVPQSMAATRDMRLPYGLLCRQPAAALGRVTTRWPATRRSTAALAREGAGDALPALKHLAALVTSEEAQEHARLADVHPPVLHTHDRYGNRVDEVEFHPSWHWLMRRAVGSGLHGTPWAGEPGSGAHVARAAGFYLMGQLESGHCCPISMTYAAVPALRHDPELATAYEPGLRVHDVRVRPQPARRRRPGCSPACR